MPPLKAAEALFRVLKQLPPIKEAEALFRVRDKEAV
jgi:hypothetical protein